MSQEKSRRPVVVEIACPKRAYLAEVIQQVKLHRHREVMSKDRLFARAVEATNKRITHVFGHKPSFRFASEGSKHYRGEIYQFRTNSLGEHILLKTVDKRRNKCECGCDQFDPTEYGGSSVVIAELDVLTPDDLLEAIGVLVIKEIMSL